jgi:hypothetical protein
LKFLGAFLVLGYSYLSMSNVTRRLESQRQLYVIHGVGMLLFLGFAAEVMILISGDRSAKAVAEKAVPRIYESTQVVFYDTYLAGVAFYLRADRPIWLVTHGDKKRTFLGNYYAIATRKHMITPWGDAIFDYDEFREKWHAARQPLLVVVKEQNLSRLTENIGTTPTPLAAVDEYLLVAKP